LDEGGQLMVVLETYLLNLDQIDIMIILSETNDAPSIA
jgi:hypothetical protein